MKKSKPESIDPKYLVPLKHAAWDGWFAISIFPPGSPVRWLKAHLYSRSCRPGMQPFSLVEGIGHASEVCIMWATGDSVEIRQSVLEQGRQAGTAQALEVSYGENFKLTGEWPSYSMSFALPDGGPSALFDFEAGWPIWWSKFGPMLQYIGQHSHARVRLSEDGASKDLDGFGVIEHVAGAAAPFDITARAPLHFHWDVLVFDGGSTPFDSAAGLSFGSLGQTLVPLKARAQMPGRNYTGMRGLWVRYLEAALGTGAEGEDIMIPLHWEGLMRHRTGTFRYRARAATPVAKVIPGGGMLGFDFEGRWTQAGSRPALLRGYGFNEYGDFSRGLLRLT